MDAEGFPESVIYDLDPEALQVIRRGKATVVSGRATPGPVTQLTIVGRWQPATGRDLQRLPELRRTLETRVLYTTDRLIVGGQGQPNEADLVVIEGVQWEVQTSEFWHGYTRALIQVPS